MIDKVNPIAQSSGTPDPKRRKPFVDPRDKESEDAATFEVPEEGNVDTNKPSILPKTTTVSSETAAAINNLTQLSPSPEEVIRAYTDQDKSS